MKRKGQKNEITGRNGETEETDKHAWTAEQSANRFLKWYKISLVYR